MSRTRVILITILMLLVATPTSAALNPLVDLVSLESVMRWIVADRTTPWPTATPTGMNAHRRCGPRALSHRGRQGHDQQGGAVPAQA